MKFGSITTGIIADGLIFHMDAANRASYIPYATSSLNTILPSGSNSISSSMMNTFQSDPVFITKPVSASCWAFDGVDDWIDLESTTPVRLAPTRTLWGPYRDSAAIGLACSISIWYKSLDTATLGGIFDFKNNYTHLSKYSTYYQLATSGVNYVRWPYGDGADGNWHNICLVLPSSPGLSWNKMIAKFYFDGVPQAANLDNASDDEGGQWIDASLFKSSYGYLQGDVANVQIYNRALSANEVLHNYNALKGRFT